MAQPAQIDDWVTPPAAAPAGVEDWVTPPAAPARAAPVDDWVTPPPRAELRAYHPTWRERTAQFLMQEARPHEFWGRFVQGLVGSSGLGHTGTISVADVFPPTGVAFSGDEAARHGAEGRPLQAAISAIGVIPAPGVGPVARTAARAAPTVATQVAEAAERLGVTATRAVDSDAATVVRNIPTVVENPVRAASQRELDELAEATTTTLGRASRNYSPADASRRSLTDWLMGRQREGTEAVAEAAALRATEAAPVRPAPTSPREPHEILTPDQTTTIRATPEIVELSELQLASGRFQPRDRARAEYQQEARERATRLDPAQLGPSRVSDSGAPIILPDGTIISGNGRALSISEVYTNPALAERATAYHASVGPDAANMHQPVLVMRAEAMTPDEAARFADLSNRGRIAQMSATERAARDANALGSEGIALYRGGDFTAPQNAAFLRHFSERAVTSSERAAFSKGAELTQEGVQRMRAAVLHSAYEDAALISRMLESTDDNIRALTGALTDAAPGFVQLRADIRAGVAMAELDATGPLTDAVKLIADLRSRGVSPATHFAQADAFTRTDPLVEAWVRSFYNDALTRPQSRQKMAEVMEAYSTEARKHSPGGLFEDPTTAGDVLNVASRQKGASTDEGADLLSNVPSPVGPSIRDSGPPAQRPAAPAVSEAAPASGPTVERVASAAEARVASPGPQGNRVLSAEASARIVTQNLVEARKAAIAKAIGEPLTGITPERITQRLTEMARSRLPSDVNGLIRAREIIGDAGWRDVSTGILHRLGAREGGWDLAQFAKAWGDMTKNGQRVLFGGKGMPRGFQRSLGDLALLADRIPRLQQLTQSDLPPILEKLLNSKTANVIGWLVMHPLSGWSVAVPAAATQATGYALARFLARPMAAERTSRWARAMSEFAKDVNPRSVAMLRFTTQQLAEETWGE